jgi:hypothetical protein
MVPTNGKRPRGSYVSGMQHRRGRRSRRFFWSVWWGTGIRVNNYSHARLPWFDRSGASQSSVQKKKNKGGHCRTRVRANGDAPRQARVPGEATFRKSVVWLSDPTVRTGPVAFFCRVQRSAKNTRVRYVLLYYQNIEAVHTRGSKERCRT